MRTACFNKARFQVEFPYAPGITFLSAIGYNADRTQALVAMMLDDGRDSWTVKVFLLAKVAGQWQVIDRFDQYAQIV